MFGLGKKKAPALRVSLVGMNERAYQLFSMFLDGPARGSCEVVSDGSHEAVILDLDALESSRLWLDVRRKFQGPVIVLSVTEKQIQLNNAFWVPKPVKVDTFLPVIEKVRAALKNPPAASAPPERVEKDPEVAVARRAENIEMPLAPSPKAGGEAKPAPDVKDDTQTTSPAARLMSEEMDEKSQNCCGELGDAAYSDPSGQAQLFFDPAQTMLGIFRRALKQTAEGGIAKIERQGAHPIYVGNGLRFVSTPMPEAYLRAVCARNISESPIDVVLLDVDAKTLGVSEDPRLRRLDNMLWKISLWSSRGRVPLGTSLSAPVRLRSWPNIPRLMTVPHEMRIAALWLKEPSGLLETAQKLGVPCRYVFAFYTACQSFDLVEQQVAAQSEVTPAHAKPVSTEKRGLFGSLLKKLGFG